MCVLCGKRELADSTMPILVIATQDAMHPKVLRWVGNSCFLSCCIGGEVVLAVCDRTRIGAAPLIPCYRFTSS